MDADDPTQPLLGRSPNNKWRAVTKKLCNLQTWRRRLPITIWLPNYSFDYLLRDAIAGITVGLTSIPQGIAYAILAGLPPQVGLYSSIFPGVVYAMFGSCKDVTVGPTAILAALIAKYVEKSPDFAYLASFLSGCVILLLGVLQLGFLLDFISKPVISGFTTAAALQISASQLKSLFRVTGSSGGTFINAITNFFKNIKTIHPWDTVLGMSTIVALYLLKFTTMRTEPSDSRGRIIFAKFWLYIVRARNALVVFFGLILAYVLKVYGVYPFALTGTIEGGLPKFGPPPFTTTVNNQTLNFEQMMEVFGPEGFAMPLVAILESIAIAKAFAGGKRVDATQEMIAIGACNLLSSFAQSMPATGSFTRTALNHASGVVTPAGCLFKASVVLLAVTLLAEAFYYIPRATLAGIIIVAMMSLFDFSIAKKLWISSKAELAIWLLTILVGITAGLEYGIAAGAAADALRALCTAARPHLYTTHFKVGSQDVTCVLLQGTLSYACAEHLPRALRKLASNVVVLDAAHLRRLDIGVIENLISMIIDLEKQKLRFLLWNFDVKHQNLFESFHPGIVTRFVSGPDVEQFVIALNGDRRESDLASHSNQMTTVILDTLMEVIFAERYKQMIEIFFSPELERMGLQDVYFQQDGATAHTARISMALLREMFPGHLICLGGDFPWAARSSDLVPCDYFLWGYFKAEVYKDRPSTLEELKHNIRREIGRIQVGILEKVESNFKNRLHQCIESDGRRLNGVLFKTT